MIYEPIAMLETLRRFAVRFVLIGGAAGSAHGSASITYDVDICYDRRPDNLERVAEALRAMNAKLRGVDDDVPFLLDAKTLAAGDSFTFQTRHGAFDVLGTPSGTQGYDDLRKRAVDFDFDGFTVAVASLDDLIHMKRAAGRPKDRVELEILGALRDELEGR